MNQKDIDELIVLNKQKENNVTEAIRENIKKIELKIQNMTDILYGGITSNNLNKGSFVQSASTNWFTAQYLDKDTNLDDIADGETYSKVLTSALHNSLPLLSEAVGNIDDIEDGSEYGKVAITSISGGKIVLAQAIGDLDDIADGTNYGKVSITSISAGKILLSETTGSLDNISDGETYGKVALTSISAGRIVVAGLDSGVTDRLFSAKTAKDAIEAWRHTTDTTMINGGKIYANSLVLANSAYDFNWSTLDDDGHKPDNDADVTGDNTAADITNLPATTSGAGLYATGTYLGYYSGTAWKAYIQSNGNFYFGGDSSNYLQWDGSTLKIKGTLEVSSLSAINSTLGSVSSGTISSSQIKFTTSSSYSAYFTSSGIYVYDGYSVHSAPAITFYKSSSYKRFAILLGTSGSGVYSETKLVLTGGGTSVSIINGVLALPNLSSNPTGQYGGICMVSGQLKYYDGSNWVNA